MLEPTKKGWQEAHPRWAFGLGALMVLIGLACIIYGGAAAAGEVELLGETCVKTVVTESEPADDPQEPAEVQSTESTSTCSPSGIVGPAAVPIVVGLILCIPAIRLLIADLEVTLGPFSIKKADAKAIDKAEAANQDDWSTSVEARLAELQVLVEDTNFRLRRLDEISDQVGDVRSQLDAFPQNIKARRKRRDRA